MAAVSSSRGRALRFSTQMSSRLSSWLAKTTSNLAREDYYPASYGSFSQTPPKLYNPFIEDKFLRDYLSFKLPNKVKDEIFTDLDAFGELVSNVITQLGREAETNPPSLKQYNAWGQRINCLVTSDAWKKLHDFSAREGLVAIGYERKYGFWSRLYQFAKLYLFTPSSGLYSCPLAMTDGAAKLIEVVDVKELKDKAYKRLISRDPSIFWTSGQWMTERKGGSDVANGTATYAIKDFENSYHLYGYKWFSSATDADMAFTLARVQDDNGNLKKGSQGLSLFYVETRNEVGLLNKIQIERLKNKLGTRQLPTAELLLNGTQGYMIGQEGRGVAMISPMLTITRLHNSISAAGSMRRIMCLARDYATKRKAFGKYLADHSLHIRTLSDLELETRACTILTLELTELLGKEECKVAHENELHLLRLFTPVTKLYTAKKAVSVISEGLECFGGQGYIEDTGLPALFRDAQVLPIWEGTTNILSLDVLRALQKTNGKALKALVSKVKRITANKDRLQFLGLECEANLINEWTESVVEFNSVNKDNMVTAARDYALSLACIYIGTLFLEKACHKNSNVIDMNSIKRWCSTREIPLKSQDQYKESDIDLHLVMEGHQTSLKEQQ